jgi:hypothetical protein
LDFEDLANLISTAFLGSFLPMACENLDHRPTPIAVRGEAVEGLAWIFFRILAGVEEAQRLNLRRNGFTVQIQECAILAKLSDLAASLRK